MASESQRLTYYSLREVANVTTDEATETVVTVGVIADVPVPLVTGALGPLAIPVATVT